MRRALLLPVLLLLLLIGVIPGLLAQDAAELALDHSVTSDFVTPHTDWATPYALGNARVLFFVRGHGTDPRAVIELKQRFDLEPEMVFWARLVDSDKEGWHGGENGVRRMDKLLEQKWDAFVFLGVPLERMPPEQQYKLLRQVIDGAGLVCCGFDDKRVLKDKNRIKDLPAFLADVPGAAAFAIKQGQGVRVSEQPKIDYAPGWEVAYDEWAMRLGKAILWAAGKAPRVELSLQPTGSELGRALLPGKAADLLWGGAMPGAVCNLTLRRSDGATWPLAPVALKTAAGSVGISLPLVAAGRYWLDAVCTTGKTVAAFASTPLTVTSPRQVTAFTFDRDWGEIGEKLTGKVACTGDVTGADERLIVSLYDPRGRELIRQNLGSVPTEATFSFPIEDWLPMLVTVRASLVNGGAELPTPREISSAWKFAHVVKRNRGQFNFLIWDTPTGTLGPYGEESLAANGTTLQLSGGTPADYVAANNIAWVPYTTRIVVGKNPDGTMKPACWNDEAMIQAQVDAIVQKSIGARQHGVFVYSLGDEGDVRGSCTSPQCLAAYQNYLQQQYGNIAALNASWNTEYDSFQQITLSKPDDDNELEAFRAGNFPRWFDRQAYQSYNFCKLCERFGKGFTSIDPQAKCGFEGAGTFAAADDLDGFVRSNTFWSPYPGTADEVVRSIAPRDFPRSNWMGYTKDADSLLEKYWRMLTRGTDSVWWWRWDCIGAFRGCLSPTLDPYPAVKDILRDTQIVRDGLGDLLLKSQMQDDGVGILFSQSSAYATKVQSSPSFGSYESDHSAWHSALREWGLNFRYFTDRQMRLGEVDLKQFKVIILPLTQALGPQEAQMLRQYVEDGGTLVADVRPGIYDGHVKPLANGLLDDVFGVKRTAFSDAALVDGVIKGANGELPLSKLRVDTGVEAVGAEALGTAGKTPLFVHRMEGKGQAILLNFPLSSYPSLAADTTPEPVAQIFLSLLDVAGVSPALSLNNAKGARLRNIEVTRWTNGDTQIISIFRHSGLPETARVTLPAGVHVYDLKNRKDLGSQKELTLTITPCRAQFFALTEQAAPAAELTPARPVAAPGTLQTVRVSVANPHGQQAVKLQVKLPSGAVADWLTKVVVTDAKGVVVELPIAYNDPPGTWTVTATELLTNRASTCQFGVR